MNPLEYNHSTLSGDDTITPGKPTRQVSNHNDVSFKKSNAGMDRAQKMAEDTYV